MDNDNQDKSNKSGKSMYRINPDKDSIKFLFIYLVVGFAWILFSDSFLDLLIDDMTLIMRFQTYKGWLYVLVTGVIFYLIIRSKLILLDKNAQSVNKLAYYDQLTELPNRFLIEEIGIQKIDLYKEMGEEFAFLLIDIDNFKHINDTMGHKVGDQLIIHVRDILSDIIKPPHVLARTGGDEFTVIISDSKNKVEVLQLLDEILSGIRKPWLINDHDIFISISAGIAFFPEHGENFEEISKNADIAMTHVKESEKDGYAVFNPSMVEKTWQRMLKISKLRNAIEKKEFYLDYQPIFNMDDHRFVGVEALLRWKDGEGKIISPGDFIPLAEETGLINGISDWVFQSICEQLNLWDVIGLIIIKLQ